MNEPALPESPGLDRVGFFKMLFLAAVVVFVATPLVATVLGGFKSVGELRTNPFGLPQHWVFENYAGILTTSRYWVLMRNSLVIAILTVVLTLITAAMAAFTFSHIRFFGRALLLNY